MRKVTNVAVAIGHSGKSFVVKNDHGSVVYGSDVYFNGKTFIDSFFVSKQGIFGYVRTVKSSVRYGAAKKAKIF